MVESIVKLSELVELPVVELSDADCMDLRVRTGSHASIAKAMSLKWVHCILSDY